MTNGSEEPLLSTPNKRKSDGEEATSKKKVKKVDFGSSSVESDNDEAESVKVNGDVQPPKTPKAKLELPEGYEVIEKKTEKKSWKEYKGPDGKMYRSIAQIHRALEGISEPKRSSASGSSSASKVDSEKLQACVDDVVENWNTDDKGDLKRNKKKFYESEGLKKLPKTDRHFVTKGKPSTSSVDDNEEDKEEEVSFSASVEVKTHANATITDVENAAKKKKKKKNKNKDKTI